jgi:hypothetical protein
MHQTTGKNSSMYHVQVSILAHFLQIMEVELHRTTGQFEDVNTGCTVADQKHT